MATITKVQEILQKAKANQHVSVKCENTSDIVNGYVVQLTPNKVEAIKIDNWEEGWPIDTDFIRDYESDVIVQTSLLPPKAPRDEIRTALTVGLSAVIDDSFVGKPIDPYDVSIKVVTGDKLLTRDEAENLLKTIDAQQPFNYTSCDMFSTNDIYNGSVYAISQDGDKCYLTYPWKDETKTECDTTKLIWTRSDDLTTNREPCEYIPQHNDIMQFLLLRSAYTQSKTQQFYYCYGFSHRLVKTH